MSKASRQLGRVLLLNLAQGDINMGCADLVLKLAKAAKKAGRVERKVRAKWDDRC